MPRGGPLTYLFSGERGRRGLFGTLRIAGAAGGAAVGGAAVGGGVGGAALLVVGLMHGLAAEVRVSVLLHSLLSLRLETVSTMRHPSIDVRVA